MRCPIRMRGWLVAGGLAATILGGAPDAARAGWPGHHGRGVAAAYVVAPGAVVAPSAVGWAPAQSLALPTQTLAVPAQAYQYQALPAQGYQYQAVAVPTTGLSVAPYGIQTLPLQAASLPVLPAQSAASSYMLQVVPGASSLAQGQNLSVAADLQALAVTSEYQALSTQLGAPLTQELTRHLRDRLREIIRRIGARLPGPDVVADALLNVARDFFAARGLGWAFDLVRPAIERLIDRMISQESPGPIDPTPPDNGGGGTGQIRFRGQFEGVIDLDTGRIDGRLGEGQEPPPRPDQGGTRNPFEPGQIPDPSRDLRAAAAALQAASQALQQRATTTSAVPQAAPCPCPYHHAHPQPQPQMPAQPTPPVAAPDPSTAPPATPQPDANPIKLPNPDDAAPATPVTPPTPTPTLP